MGDIKGFIKYGRSLPNKEPSEERIHHFNEFILKSTKEHSKEQSARCMDCGVPFCHSSCPLGNLIPDFNDAVYKGKWKLAYELLISTNNFPEFTGRICPAPCEAGCVLGINEDPVSIEYIEKSIIERAFHEGWVKVNNPINTNGVRVAIIGSGPAGLTCADELNRKGFSVTVFERNDKIGGLLRYGIPDFKLNKNIIDRRLDLLKAAGIEFKTKCNVGEDITAKELKSQYDAIILTGGSTIPRDLPIPGRSLKGVHLAMDFLEENNRSVSGELINDPIQVKGEDVIVIGGGDTGSDCIGTSNRLGAKSINQIELLAKPPIERSIENPWPLWPMTLKSSSSHEEGCERSWSILTKKFISEDGIHLSGIEVVKISWEKNENGKYILKELPESKTILPCTKAFLAIGFLHPQKEGLLNQLGVSLDDRGNVFTNDYLTSVDHVYAAGDMRRGQSLVVWAIAEGRECANRVSKDFRLANSEVLDSTMAVLDL